MRATFEVGVNAVLPSTESFVIRGEALQIAVLAVELVGSSAAEAV